MECVRHSWLAKRQRGIHMTIRDIDCKDFDVEAMVRTFAEWRVTFFSFFAAGYVTTYPTRLPLQRVSPWLNGRDLTGEIIAAAHQHDIRAIPMIDLGQLPEAAYRAHPEWATVDAEGCPIPATDGPLYRACPLGGYVRAYSREIIAELVERYPLDGIKFGGGSYGFGAAVCHCPACRERYLRDTGCPLPHREDWNDPDWRRYYQWKKYCTAETVRHLVQMVREIAPGIPVVGNAVCFGDPGWTLRASLDIEELTTIQDIAQVEVQTRFRYDPVRDAGYWQYLRWPSETARYMTSVTDRPIWTVCSYFLAWPWRRNAVPAAEQTAYLAQMAANGATPMVNLSGGPPKVHEDPSGFQAIQTLYRFMAEHETLYEDCSAANVALVYSQETLEHHGDRAEMEYVQEIRGWELALDEAHIPFDILSTRILTPERLKTYRVLVLPRATILSEAQIEALKAFVRTGGGLVADFDCGLYAPDGARREDFPLAEVLGISLAGEPRLAVEGMHEYAQAYMRRSEVHPITASLEETGLLPLLGRFVPVQTAPEVSVPLRRSAPFRVFPEGWAYTTEKDPGEPLLVAHEAKAGRVAYFASLIGKAYHTLHYPPLGMLMADAVRWALGEHLLLKVEAPSTLQVSLRHCAEGYAIHCVNLTGGERYMREIVPLHSVRLALAASIGKGISKAVQISTGEALPFRAQEEWAWVEVPTLGLYDVILFAP